MMGTTGIAVALAVVGAVTIPGDMASAAESNVQSNVDIFDARAAASASSYCVDVPAVLIGQQICGGFLASTVTATSDPRGFALGGLAPAPKLSSVPLLIPNSFQGIPVPEQVQAGLKQIKFNNVPSQCQAAFPELNPGDSDQTCGGPTYGDTALGFIGAGANARVYSTGDQANPTQTRTAADSRATYANLTGLQSTYDNVRSVAESGLGPDGNPAGVARMNAGNVTLVGGLLTIDGIVSSTKVTFNGTKSGAAASTLFKYAGAAIAGIPVDITPQGVTLATDKVPADQVMALTTQLNTVLANNNGFGVKLLPAPPIEITSSLARASSGGILITYKGTAGADVTYSQLIGNTSAQVSAISAAGVLDSADSGAVSGGGAGTDTAGGSGAAPAGTVDSAGINPDAGAGLGPIATGALPNIAGATGASIPVTQNFRSVGDQALLANFPSLPGPLSPSRLQDLYVIFCLVLFAGVVAARFRRRPLSPTAG